MNLFPFYNWCFYLFVIVFTICFTVFYGFLMEKCPPFNFWVLGVDIFLHACCPLFYFMTAFEISKFEIHSKE